MIPPSLPRCWLCDEPVIEGMPAVTLPDGAKLHLSCVTYVQAMEPGVRAHFLRSRQRRHTTLPRKEPLS